MNTVRKIISHRAFIPILAILVLLGASYGGYRLYQNYQKDQLRQKLANNKRPSAGFQGIANNKTVSGTTPIAIKSSDPDGIKAVKFYVTKGSNQFELVRTDTKAPYCLAGDSTDTSSNSTDFGCLGWDSKSLSNGNHKILGVIEDKLGAVTRILVTFKVQN